MAHFGALVHADRVVRQHCEDLRLVHRIVLVLDLALIIRADHDYDEIDTVMKDCSEKSVEDFLTA